ncbi:hypothetical protein [Prauserella flavalba]|uniref:Uncharacterized protein n=1 Tax=Prauserella flavalba TaxID=1477506 RepID=A0A318LUZ9_9PSEU|nr:hypothetical protein [Prauserella flavalba]PXY37631.1 hypothetical protein BA062_03075 [Prauserella flavalba]
MAPKVLRQTPHDADLLDRTGIIGASVPGAYSGDGPDDGVPVRRVNRSGIASMAAAVLMAVVAFGAVVDGRPGQGAGTPMAGEAAGGGPIVVVETPRPTEVEGKASPDPGAIPAPETVDPPAPVAVVEEEPQPEPEPVPEPEPEPVIAAEAQVPELGLPEARMDLPAGMGPSSRFTDRMREFIDPMFEHYLEQRREAMSAQRDRDDDSDDSDSRYRGDFGYHDW